MPEIKQEILEVVSEETRDVLENSSDAVLKELMSIAQIQQAGIPLSQTDDELVEAVLGDTINTTTD